MMTLGESDDPRSRKDCASGGIKAVYDFLSQALSSALGPDTGAGQRPMRRVMSESSVEVLGSRNRLRHEAHDGGFIAHSAKAGVRCRPVAE